MNSDARVTKEDYVIDSLSREIGNLTKRLRESEFTILLYQEENERLNKELQAARKLLEESEDVSDVQPES